MIKSYSVTKYNPSASQQITLTVGTPIAKITSITFPQSPQKYGAQLKLSFSIRNDGITGYIYWRVRDNRTLEEFGSWVGTFYQGETRGWDVYITMPNRDITLQLNAGHVVDTTYYMDDYKNQDILLLIEIDTQLTLNLNKTTAQPGETLTATGKLTRKDTGAGLGSQTVKLFIGTTQVTYTTTGSDGSYSMSFTAPSQTGTYNVYSKFEGSQASATLSILSQQYTDIILPIALIGSGMAIKTIAHKKKVK